MYSILMGYKIICDCGAIFNHEGEVEFHRATIGHIWNKLKAMTNNNYVHISNHAKMKIPENTRCDICNEKAYLKGYE
jgi:hypothetical protein